ncbi:MAG: hypothetical protein AB7T06_05940 [Kofleriaceae bacterium]
MTRRLLSLALLSSAPAHAQPPKAISTGGTTASEIPRARPVIDPVVTRRIFAAKVRAVDDPLAKPSRETDLAWVDVPRVLTEEDERDRPKKRRTMVAPMSSPTGGKGIKLKIPF